MLGKFSAIMSLNIFSGPFFFFSFWDPYNVNVDVFNVVPWDFTGCSAGKESACNAGELGSIPGLGRSPGRRQRLPTPVFWPREVHGLYSPWSHKELDTAERLSLSEIS